MKLTIKNNKYNLELNKFELDSFAWIAGSIAGTSKVRKIFSYEEESFLENYSKVVNVVDFPLIARELNIQYGFGEVINPTELPPKIEKKNCSFFYPKSAYRNRETNNIEHFESRMLKEAYIEDNYLIGLDKTIKKFTLSKVKHLTWE